MVRCLAWNDLIALVGSFSLMYMQLYMRPALVTTRWFCALRVMLRTFGLSSGCVAIVMAVERWLALTRPFVYHKHVTYTRIWKSIFSLWLVALVLVCLPFMGFGLYYDSGVHDKRFMCVRYRFARTPCDVAYAYLMFVFGMLLCVVIVVCNLGVVTVLCRMGKKCLARMGRTTIRKDNKELSFNHTTPEEVSFAKLMVILCVFFVSCWVPQMVTILMAQVNVGKMNHPFYRIADICIALNFTLDPVVYVLSRRPHRKGFRRLMKPLCQFCWPNRSRDGSIRSTTQVTAVLYKANFVSPSLRVRQDKRHQHCNANRPFSERSLCFCDMERPVSTPIGRGNSCRRQRGPPTKYRMKYPPDNGPPPRCLRRYAKAEAHQATNYLRKYPPDSVAIDTEVTCRSSCSIYLHL